MNVHDSLFPDVDETACTFIKNMFGGDECEISMKTVQAQCVIKDCGVFAIRQWHVEIALTFAKYAGFLVIVRHS